MSSNFDLVSSVYDRLAKKADRSGTESLSLPEQTVLYACWGKSEVDNGGFALLYSTPANIDNVVRAFASLGLEPAAQAAERSKRVFPEGQPPSELEARRKAVDALCDPDKDKDPWEEESKAIWDVEQEDFDQVVADFIRANPATFESA